MLTCRLANRIWKAASFRHWRRFQRAQRDPRRAQHDWLMRFLRRNADSEYGRRNGYEHIKSIREFQDRVPLVNYDDLQPWVNQIITGRQGVLTSEPVLFFEKTSGSLHGAKYIPYTASLKREFQRAVGAWMYDLFRHRPRLLDGPHYWSISPIARERETTLGGLPVGIEDDAEYLSRIERYVLSAIMAVPSSVARVDTIEECRRETMRHLVSRPDLRLISVWHPSFLSLLLEELPAGKSPAECWPNLSLISCWRDVSAAGAADELTAQFPGVELQGKGLLATEGVITIPQCDTLAPVSAITSHFLEFIDRSGNVLLIDELAVGQQYEVAITTGNGFARYRLGDVVQVVYGDDDHPCCLKFIGRTATSDLCGEKLSEAFVGSILRKVTQRSQRKYGLPQKTFMMLAPEQGTPPHYVLLVDCNLGGAFVDVIATDVETQLRGNVHYDYCRRLGQLGPVEGVVVRDGLNRYLQACQTQGQRAGDVKSTFLRCDLGWPEKMTGKRHQEVAHVN